MLFNDTVLTAEIFIVKYHRNMLKTGESVRILKEEIVAFKVLFL
jgi:hypothetical protein